MKRPFEEIKMSKEEWINRPLGLDGRPIKPATAEPVKETLQHVVNNFTTEQATPPSADTGMAIEDAMHRVWALGQLYWYQSDHEFSSYHKKADETEAKFKQLIDDTKASAELAIAAAEDRGMERAAKMCEAYGKGVGSIFNAHNRMAYAIRAAIGQAARHSREQLNQHGKTRNLNELAARVKTLRDAKEGEA